MLAPPVAGNTAQNIVQRRRLGLGPLVAFGMKLFEQPFHLGHGIGHRGQHVLLEFRIILVFFGILQHQRQLADKVLHIVDNKGETAVERLHLAGIIKGTGCHFLGQITRRLTADGLQQVDILPVQTPERPRFAQHQQGLQPVAVAQRQHQPGPFAGGNPFGQNRFRPLAADRQRLLAGLKPGNQRMRFGKRRDAGREIPVGGGEESAVFRPVDQQHRCRAVDQIGNGMKNARMQPHCPVIRGQGLNEIQPALPVIVFILEKIGGNETAQIGPYGA